MRVALLLASAVSAERSVRVWQTAQGEGILEPLQPVPLQPGTSQQPTLELNASEVFQSMLGFGGAFTESAALNVERLRANAPERYEELMEAYFGDSGLRYNFARVPMGSCDFSPYSPSWSYAEVADDFELAHFNMSNDEQRRLPWIKDAQQKALAGGRSFKVLGSPWSAPGWMKSNGAMICGTSALLEGCTLKKDPKYHEAFARYFVRWANEYEKALGQPVWGFTIMNEPQENLLTYEGQKFTAETERDFIRDYLGPLMKSEAPEVKLLILDHDKDKLPEWTETILGDAEAAQYVWGTAVHWYSGDHFEELQQAHERFPDFQLLATESTAASEGNLIPGSGAAAYRRNGTWSKAEHYAHDMIGDFNNHVTGFIDWNLVLDLGSGPLHVNFEVSDAFGSHSAVHVDESHVYYQTIFQYIGHFSRFVPEGARRIGWRWAQAAPSLEVTSFATDSDLVVVVMNANDNATSYAISEAGETATLSIPAHAIQTLVFPLAHVALV